MLPGERVKQVRETLKLTQNEFGAELGFKWYKIKDIETGKQKLTPEIALEIEKKFAIDYKWLLTGHGEMRPRTQQSATGNGFIQGQHISADEIHIDIHAGNTHVSDEGERYSDPILDAFVKDWLELSEVSRLRAWTLVKELKQRDKEVKEGLREAGIPWE